MIELGIESNDMEYLTACGFDEFNEIHNLARETREFEWKVEDLKVKMMLRLSEDFMPEQQVMLVGNLNRYELRQLVEEQGLVGVKWGRKNYYLRKSLEASGMNIEGD